MAFIPLAMFIYIFSLIRIAAAMPHNIYMRAAIDDIGQWLNLEAGTAAAEAGTAAAAVTALDESMQVENRYLTGEDAMSAESGADGESLGEDADIDTPVADVGEADGEALSEDSDIEMTEAGTAVTALDESMQVENRYLTGETQCQQRRSRLLTLRMLSATMGTPTVRLSARMLTSRCPARN